MRLKILFGLGLLAVLLAGLVLGHRIGLRPPKQIPIAASNPPKTGCELVRYIQIVFRPDSDPSGIDWELCPARENEPSSQFVHVRGLHKNEADLWTFGPADHVEQLDVLEVGPEGSQQLMVVEESAGSGAYIKWCVLGWTGKGLACWPHPGLEAAGKELLKSDEDFCCKDWTLKFSSGVIILGRGIYQKGVDGNCCPSRGGAFLRLTPKDQKLRIGRAWRTDKSTYDRWLRSAHARGPEAIDTDSKLAHSNN
jgi:hypothetical protein